MSGYDTWDDERGRLLRGLGEDLEGRVAAGLDAAAAAAQSANLNEAARHLERARSALVAAGHFRRVDDDILCFASLINIIRKMSSETAVPKAYQRFIDAIPSLRYDAEMTRSQRTFWYGDANAQVGGHIAMMPAQGGASSSDDVGQGILSLLVLAAIAAAAWYFLA
jgi:hypothetical protein